MDATSDATRAFGTLEYIKTAAASFATATKTVSPVDALVTARYALKAKLRRNAVWQVAPSTLAVVKTWKDPDGRFVWAPCAEARQPSLLLGHPLEENEDMDAIGANKFPVAVGNWKAEYTVVDRIGIRMLRDPYTNKP